MIWNRVPFLRIILPFILGILLWEVIPSSSGNVMIISGGLLLLLLALSFNKIFSGTFKSRWIYGAVFNVALCSFAYLLTGSQSDLTERAHFATQLTAAGQGMLLRLNKPAVLKDKSVQAEVEVLQIQDSTHWQKTLGTAIIYFKRDSLSENLEVGDKCMAFGSLERVKGPTNPGAFNYAKYLSRSDIYFSAYISDKRWKRIGQDHGFNLSKSLNRFKLNLERFMAESGVSKEAHSVISALTLGDKAELSQDLKTSYSKAGVLHILAVSGLHVGIFYLILNFLLVFLEKLKNGKHLKLILVIAGLWGYAVLTGMSPSVSRAATMFTFVVIGTALHKHTNIYNTLCVSAFFLLLYQPNSLFNVGFLLSYTAVFGIVYLYPKIYGIWASKYWLFDKIWVLMSISLAAQIVTFPLSLYYFHQFPNYFLVANIIVVPLATGIIYLTLVLFALIPFEFLAKPMAGIISFFVELLNTFVRWIEGLPFAVTDGIEISLLQVLVIYAVIVLVISYVNTKEFKYLLATIFAILFLTVNQVIEKISKDNQHSLIVYDVPGHSAFDIIEGRHSLLTLDSGLIHDSKTIGYVMENNWRQMGVGQKSNRILEIVKAEGSTAIISVVNGHRIVYPMNMVAGVNNVKVRVDILILSQNCEASINGLTKLFDIGLIIFDSSWSQYKISSKLEMCDNYGIEYYNVQRMGAYVQDF